MITTCIELIVFYLAHGIVLMVLEASLPIKKRVPPSFRLVGNKVENISCQL